VIFENREVGARHGGPGNDRHAEPLRGECDERAQVAGLGRDSRAEAGVAADALEQAAQAASMHEGDHRMPAQVGEGDRLAPAERMIAANAEHEWSPVVVHEHDLDRGMGAMEVPQRRGEPVVHRAGEADPQPSVEHAPERGDREGGARPPMTTATRRLPTSPDAMPLSALTSAEISLSASAAAATGRRLP
jgi:hypothetical protein